MLLRRLRIGGLNLAFTVAIWLLVSSLYVPLNHNSFSSYAALWFLLPFMRLIACGRRRGQPGARSRAEIAALSTPLYRVWRPAWCS